MCVTVGVLLLPGPGVWAQSRTADSLRALLGTELSADTLRMRRLQALSAELLLKDTPNAIVAQEAALKLCRRLHDEKSEGPILMRLATLYRRQASYRQARRYTKQAQALAARRGDRAGMGVTYLQLSLIESEQSNLTGALRAAMQGLRYAEQAGDKLTQTRLQVALGAVYIQMGNYAEALPVLRATLKNAEALGDVHMVASALNLLGHAYQQLKNWPQAQNYFLRSVQLNRRLGDLQSATIDEINLSDLYGQQNNHAQALAYGLRARASAKANHDPYNLPPAELALARAYLNTQQLDSAIMLAQHGFGLSQALHNNENLRNGSDILARAYAARGQFAQAYEYRQLWAAYQDSLAGKDIQRRTITLRYGFELEKKQDQIILLTQGRQLAAQKAYRQRQEMHALLAGLLGVLLLAALLARNIYLKHRANRVLKLKSDLIVQQRDNLDQTLTELKSTQGQLVQSEKMVALAALMAGVAHEIQNPLNFVNNFSELSLELLAELKQEHSQPSRDPEFEASLLDDLGQNISKIHQHGSRASAIVKGMLEHSHVHTGQRQSVDLNALVRDYLRLAYHSLQAKYRDFTVAHSFELDHNLGQLHLEPQEVGRVLLNLFTNAYYALHQKAALLGPAYQPMLSVRTRRHGTNVELHVRDNGSGIAPAILEKVFDPFFTTKPPGDGTGLGLSLSYDTVTKGYGGQLTVQSKESEFTEFTITLPINRPLLVESQDSDEVVESY
ncbi:hypothetical protein GCM10022407_40900 [Hymenobacter antarcticus]|uniref:histidine kinase n=1 Tax=Hymenobacter antarcticus TaxID=486270 RepID=A0ABP7R420_9BACT